MGNIFERLVNKWVNAYVESPEGQEEIKHRVETTKARMREPEKNPYHIMPEDLEKMRNNLSLD